MLAGVRVLDWTGESGFLAGKIFADLGADVIKIEPPGGDLEGRRGPFLGGVDDPDLSLVWLALNTSKRGITIDPETEEGRGRYRHLVAGADVVLETFPPGHLDQRGLGYRTLGAEHPRLVHCAITPFGQTGPDAGYPAHDLVAVAMGGNLGATGDPDRPPVRCSMPTAYYHAGPEAVIGVLFALWQREDTGRGQLVDVSLHETQLQTLLTGASGYARNRQRRGRFGARVGRTREIWRAADGMVSYGVRGGAARVGSLRALVAWMNECGMASDWLRGVDWSSFSHLEVSNDDLARIENEFGAFFESKTMRGLYAGALERRILLAPCNDAREIVEHEQLRARGLFQRIDTPVSGKSLELPGFFARLRGRPMCLRRPAPRVGEHDAEIDAEIASGTGKRTEPIGAGRDPVGDVFAGLHVLEVGSGAAGPVATKYFAEHGARVIRVESAKRPDFLRVLFMTRESRFGVDGSPMFAMLNPNKESVALNLKEVEARALLEKLVVWSDVLCENYAPGVMARFGLDADRVRQIKPDIVMASGCLFGQTGPQRSYPGFGGQGSAISGFNHLTGWPDGAAHGPYGTITDSLAPRYLAIAVAAALWRRRRTGEGEQIDLSQIEAAVYSLSELIARYGANGEAVDRMGNRHERVAPHGVFPCRGDDGWLALAVWSEDQWRALVAAMGSPAWADEPRFATNQERLAHVDALEEHIAAWTRGCESHALMRELRDVGVEAGAVQSFADLLEDPQLAHRGHWQPVRHVHLGELLCERSGFRLSGGSGGIRTPGPNLGEHGHEILAELLGLSDAEIERLVESDVAV